MCASWRARSPSSSIAAIPCSDATLGGSPAPLDRREGSALQVTVVKARALAPERQAHWASLQEESPEFASPFFRPEFTTSVAAVRDDVFVAQIFSAGAVAGFFPFQRTRVGFGYPVGGGRSNYHGAVVDPGLEWDARALIRACGLRSYAFDHLLASQQGFRPYQASCSPSSVIDVSGGYEAYLADRRAAGSEIVTQTERKARKLEREVGPLRFEPESHDRSFSAHDAMEVGPLRSHRARRPIRDSVERRPDGAHPCRDRSRFCRHTVRAPSWRPCGRAGVRDALERYVALLVPDLRSRARLLFRRIILLLRITQEAARRGMRMVDLGKDEAVYKARFRTGVIDVAEGQVIPSPSLAKLVRLQGGCVALASQTPLARPLRAAKREVRLRVGGGARV